MADVLEAFLEALPETARAAFTGASDATRAQLLAHTAAARAAWPDLDIAPEDFARELGVRLGGAAIPSSPKVLADCHAADVYFAIACGRGHEGAIRRFDETFLRGAVEIAARSSRASGDQADELAAVLRRLLFVDEPPRKAACRMFSGQSTLKQYVTVIAARKLADMVNKSRKIEPLEEDELIASLAPGADPELSALRNRYRDDVDASFRAALGRLSKRSREVLRFRLLRKLPVRAIAESYKRADKTIHGWIAQARQEYGDLVRDEVATRLKVPLAEVDSIVRLVQSRIDVSFDRLESTDKPPEPS